MGAAAAPPDWVAAVAPEVAPPLAPAGAGTKDPGSTGASKLAAEPVAGVIPGVDAPLETAADAAAPAKTSTYLLRTCDSELDRDRGLDPGAVEPSPSPPFVDDAAVEDGGAVGIAGAGGADVGGGGRLEASPSPPPPPAAPLLSLRSTQDLSFSS